MTLDTKIRERFSSLLAEGDEILIRNGWPGENFRHPSIVEYSRFRTEALNLVRRACGDSSDHYRELRSMSDNQTTALNSYYFPNCFGVLQAAQRDYQGGLVFDVRSLVAAELFADLLEQAEYLFNGGFHIPAASLAGAVLEDSLRKLALRHALNVPEKTTIDRLNADLAGAGAYTKLVQKNITAYADIRNNADHGQFDKFSSDDVEAMLKWVRRFLAEYLG